MGRNWSRIKSLEMNEGWIAGNPIALKKKKKKRPRVSSGVEDRGKKDYCFLVRNMHAKTPDKILSHIKAKLEINTI